MPTQTIDLNNTTPAAPANTLNVAWQADAPSLDPTVVRNVSAYMPKFTGDAGAGGALGLVPAPAAGDAAAGKVLGAGGAFQFLPIVIGVVVLSGVTGTALLGELVAPRAGSLSKCVARVTASDPSVALTFRFKQNGIDVFTSDPTIAAGTVPSIIHFTSLTSVPLAVAADDVFTFDITAGTSAWKFTAQLE